MRCGSASSRRLPRLPRAPGAGAGALLGPGALEPTNRGRRGGAVGVCARLGIDSDGGGWSPRAAPALAASRVAGLRPRVGAVALAARRRRWPPASRRFGPGAALPPAARRSAGRRVLGRSLMRLAWPWRRPWRRPAPPWRGLARLLGSRLGAGFSAGAPSCGPRGCLAPSGSCRQRADPDRGPSAKRCWPARPPTAPQST